MPHSASTRWSQHRRRARRTVARAGRDQPPARPARRRDSPAGPQRRAQPGPPLRADAATRAQPRSRNRPSAAAPPPAGSLARASHGRVGGRRDERTERERPRRLVNRTADSQHQTRAPPPRTWRGPRRVAWPRRAGPAPCGSERCPESGLHTPRRRPRQSCDNPQRQSLRIGARPCQRPPAPELPAGAACPGSPGRAGPVIPRTRRRRCQRPAPPQRPQVRRATLWPRTTPGRQVAGCPGSASRSVSSALERKRGPRHRPRAGG